MDDQDISKILVQMDVLEKTGLEIKKEMGMNEPEILNRHLEKETEIRKEIPDHRQGEEIQHRHIMILQLVPVALQLETKTGTLKSCRMYMMLNKEFPIGWNQTDW